MNNNTPSQNKPGSCHPVSVSSLPVAPPGWDQVRGTGCRENPQSIAGCTARGQGLVPHHGSKLICILQTWLLEKEAWEKTDDLINMIHAQKLWTILGKFGFFFLSAYKTRAFEVWLFLSNKRTCISRHVPNQRIHFLIKKSHARLPFINILSVL